MKAFIKTIAGVLLLGAGYYYGVWGYFGLFMGEPNYRDFETYRIMLIGGAVAFLAGLFVLGQVIARGVRALRTKGNS